jgi:hypothetical protein
VQAELQIAPTLRDVRSLLQRADRPLALAV